MRKQIFVVIFFLASLNSYSDWIALSEESKHNLLPEITILESNNKILKLRVVINGLNFENKETGGTQYTRFWFNEMQNLQYIGEPEFPIINIPFLIPNGNTYGADIRKSKWVKIGNFTPYPAQKYSYDNSDSLDTDFVINKSLYKSVGYYPKKATMFTEEMNWKGLRIVNLVVCPFKYHFIDKELSVMKEFTVTITFNDNINSDNSNEIGKFSKNELTYLRNNLINASHELVDSYRIVNTDKITDNFQLVSQYDYLIITAPKFISSLPTMKFIDWRARYGCKCKIVSTNTTGESPIQIKNYIKSEYINSNIKYVLFIGGHEQIPAYPWGNGQQANNDITYSDYWYGCLTPFNDNDFVAEIPIGRFSTNSLDELSIMVDKTIRYEKDPYFSNWFNDSWARNVLLIAHKEFAPGKYQQCSEEIKSHNYILPKPNFIKSYGASPSNGGNSANNDYVINQISGIPGIGIVNYRGHGNTKSWDSQWGSTTESFDMNAINRLTNFQIHPVVFSIACSNGKIQSSDNCLLEDFTKTKAGAVAFLGATKPTYTVINHSFDKYLFKTIFDQGVFNIGHISLTSNLSNLLYYSNSEYCIENVKAYLWGGDPALELWTDSLNLLPNIEINDNGSFIEVSTQNLQGCEVILCNAIDKGESQHICVENSSNVVFNNIVRPYYITVKKHNYKPFISDTFLQNKELRSNNYITGKTIFIGSQITNNEAYGNVIINNSSKIILAPVNAVIIGSGFEVKFGSVLEI